MAKKPKRVVNIEVLPGEPKDGSGRVCIHLWVNDEDGPYTESHALHAVPQGAPGAKPRVRIGPGNGYIACDRGRCPAPNRKGSVVYLTGRSDDPRAVTCLKCQKSQAYKKMVEADSPAPA